MYCIIKTSHKQTKQKNRIVVVNIFSPAFFSQKLFPYRSIVHHDIPSTNACFIRLFVSPKGIKKKKEENQKWKQVNYANNTVNYLSSPSPPHYYNSTPPFADVSLVFVDERIAADLG